MMKLRNDDAKCTTHFVALLTTRTHVYGLSPAVRNVDLSLCRSVQGSRKTKIRSKEQRTSCRGSVTLTD